KMVATATRWPFLIESIQVNRFLERCGMDNAEVTIKQVADECGVSKSTAVRKFKELNLPVITRGGKGTVYLGPESASALAHALVKGRAPEVSAERASEIIDIADTISTEANAIPDATDAVIDSVARDAILEMYRDQIRSLSRTNDLFRDQINQLNNVIEAMRSQNEATIALLTDQIDRLNEQVASIQKEKDHLRDELSMSRALEGFHFPWQRDRIMSHYLLPASKHMATDEPSYEEP
ncbi:MAG: hypothetical protein IJ092_13015, partial [Atopobiaceae bacterium]|nr:hypothetical protein [Atopobiaceae bacterium]